MREGAQEMRNRRDSVTGMLSLCQVFRSVGDHSGVGPSPSTPTAPPPPAAPTAPNLPQPQPANHPRRVTRPGSGAQGPAALPRAVPRPADRWGDADQHLPLGGREPPVMTAFTCRRGSRKMQSSVRGARPPLTRKSQPPPHSVMMARLDESSEDDRNRFSCQPPAASRQQGRHSHVGVSGGRRQHGGRPSAH